MTEGKERKYLVYVIRGNGAANDISSDFMVALLPGGYHKKPVHLPPMVFKSHRRFPTQAGAKLEAECLFGPLDWKPTRTGSQIVARVTISAKSLN